MNVDVHDARPPRALLRLLNPAVKALLRSPASRAMKSLALLEFAGRRTGRPVSVVVGWHELDQVPVVFTPAPWQANFAGGTEAIVRCRGRRERQIGTLEADPAAVADAIDSVIRQGTSPRALGLRVAEGHAVTADDVVRLGRAMVRFNAVHPSRD